MVRLNKDDLQFILKQIMIAEAHAAGIPLTAIRLDPNGIPIANPNDPVYSDPNTTAPLAISDPHLPYGLRTVDGSYNNIVPGRELWGAADQPMPRMLDGSFLNDADGDTMPLGPGFTVTNNNYGTSGNVADADPRLISNLIVDMSVNNPAAVEAWFNNPLSQALWAEQHPGMTPIRPGETPGPNEVVVTDADLATILNISPDVGLSKPFNGWMTFFGQFFDHGLDLISKGGNGTVFIPLQPDDPLITHGPDGIAGSGDEVPPQSAFMVLTRSTPTFLPGADGQLGTSDDVPTQTNTTTPFVDQNQTYTSHPSHQVFLREYQMVGGQPLATGRLLDGSTNGLPTWADIKDQARTMLGIELTDRDILNLPLLRTDAYGEFIRGSNGLPLVILGIGADGIPNTDDDVVVQGDLASPVNTFTVSAPNPPGGTLTGAIRTGHAFLDDIAHSANPLSSQGQLLQADDDNVINTGDLDHNGVIDNGEIAFQAGRYDNELLDRHFITGDGRGNENIGLTAVHHIFHSEHNRLVDANKLIILQTADLAFINQWLAVDLANLNGLPADLEDLNALKAFADGLAWDGERLFQSARFGTEMQYQHLVFEEFARKIQPLIDPFVFNSITEINPAIFAEFANVVYRFGHSMLTDDVVRIAADGQHDDLSLIAAFLNPLAFDDDGAMTADEAAGAVVRGMTHTQGNEIDEFIVNALRNNLLGLPLDLATINIARGRDTGMPTLNEARAQLYAATSSTFLQPYDNWVDFAANLKNPMSVVNFLAAYGQHSTILSADTLAEKRDAAMLLVFGGSGAPADRLQFLNGTNGWTAANSGLNSIDLWIGGLAEKQMPFGGMLGSTFNAVFEAQMEALQDADRFYYLTRTQGLNFLNELENNAFSKLIIANTDLSQAGPDGIRGTSDDVVPRHIGVDAFAQYDYVLEVDQANQDDPDPQGDNPVLEALGRHKVLRDDPTTSEVETNYLRFTGGEHVVLGGTSGNDTLIGDEGDDAIWGDAGNDRIEGGAGVDLIIGGAGDDIITDSGDSGDFIKGEEGDDVIANSNGIDILIGGDGKDVFFVGVDATEVFAGEGDDFILGGDDVDLLMGSEGDDWIEGGPGFDTTAGDNSQLFFNSTIVGHDVMFAGSDEHDFDAESGDDIMVQGESVMRNEGMFGFDWAIFKGMARDGYADMRIKIFTTEEQDILRNRFDKVEALSGWKHNDTLIGDDRTLPDPAEPVGGATVGANEATFFQDGLDQAGIDRIAGLNQIVQLANGQQFFEAGNILLGGAGSDTFRGNAGDDIIDGDRWLNVRISIRDEDGDELDTIDSLKDTLHNEALGWKGKSLQELMLSGTIKPKQLNIVREILDDGALSSDEDVAIFGDVLANYSIERQGDKVIISHVGFGTDPLVLINDGTDTLRNVEIARFADQDLWIANRPPTGVPTITGTENVLTADTSAIADPDGLGPFSYQWQTSADGINNWTNVGGATGQNFTVPAGNLSFFRVVVSYTDGGQTVETIASDMSARVGTNNNDGSNATPFAGNGGPNLINGRNGNDVLAGLAGNDVINGGGGNDTITGSDGDDVLAGGAGNDSLNGGAGNDRLVVDINGDPNDNDVIAGGADTDTLAIVDGGGDGETLSVNYNGTRITQIEGAGTINADVERVTADLAGGTDTLAYTAGSAAVAVDLATGAASGFFSIANIENVSGTDNADTLAGSATANALTGGAGGDSLTGGAGNDTLDGGTGADTMQGGADNDTYVVDSAGDVVDETAAGSGGTDTVQTSLTNYTLGSGLENLTKTGATAFTGVGNALANVITGNNGADTIDGDAGADTIDGDDGNDRLRGGAGDDTFNDNSGNDVYVYDAASFGNDTINGFDANGGAGAQDFIDLSGLGITAANFAARVQIQDVPDAGTDDTRVTIRDAANAVIGTIFIEEVDGADITQADFLLAAPAPVNGTGAGNNITGTAANDTINGQGGNDTINGGAGDDTIVNDVLEGRDIVNGGSEGSLGDTFVVNGNATAETFTVFTRAAWDALPGNNINNLQAGTEIVITRGGTDNASIIAELSEIEEIVINGLNVPPAGNAGGDTINVVGDFSTTSLNLSTITVQGTVGDDTVDITGLNSAHRIVFKSNGGNDTVIGTLRPQDVIELADGQSLDDYDLVDNGDGTKTLSNGTHSITFASSGNPVFDDDAITGAFELTARDVEGLENLVRGIQAFPDDDDTEGATGVRDLEGAGNNVDNPDYGAATQPFIRITQAHYGELNQEGNNREINPIFDGLDPRDISNILGVQEAGLPKAENDGNIFFMAFGQYFDHGLDFIPKSGVYGTIEIGGPGAERAPGTDNPADLTRGEVSGFDQNGVPQHLNKASPFVDQNQAYGSTELVGQFLRESDGDHGVGMRLLQGAEDPSSPGFKLLPTLRELIQHHWDNDTVFHDEALGIGPISFRTYYSHYPIGENTFGDLINPDGSFDPDVTSAVVSNFMGSGYPLLLDTNPFVSVLDHYIAGDGRANENFALTAIHTIWARNHNFHVEKLIDAGFQGTPEQVFQAAKMLNEAEYQRVVFTEFADKLIGGMRGDGDHGFEEYNPEVDARISHEFAAAVYRVGHSLIGQTMMVLDANGQPQQVALFDAFLNPSNDPSVFTAPLPPGYVPQPGYAQHGVDAIIGGIVTQPAEAVDFNIVDAVRNDLVRINADLFSFNVARGRDVGLGTLNQIRADLAASTDPYIREAVGFAGNMDPYASWEDFQQRNGLSDTVINQFKQAYPDLVLSTAQEIDAFVAANPDIDLLDGPSGAKIVKGIDRVDLWVGGLAEAHINGGMVGQTFWVVLHEQFDRLQEGDRFYYLERFDNFDFYENFVDGQEFADIIARNTGLTGLPEDIFAADGFGDDDQDDDDDTTDPGNGDDDTTNPDDDDDDTTDPDGDDDTTNPGDDDDDQPTPPPPGAVLDPLVGTPTGDVLTGTDAAEDALAFAGDDVIVTGGGDDTVSAGEGHDFIKAGAGRDVVFAGAGDDQVFGEGGADIIFGDAGADRIFAGDGDDMVNAGAGDDLVMAGSGDDVLVAEAGDGNDTYYGEDGTDTLDMSALTAAVSVDLGGGQRGTATSAQSGTDNLWSIENVITGSGNDTITASNAVNVLDGGAGNDTFRFETIGAANGDTIVGFQPGDKIDLAAIDANTGAAGDQAFVLNAGANLTGPGQLTVTYQTTPSGDITLVQGNVDGDNGADFTVTLEGHHTLTQQNFNP